MFQFFKMWRWKQQMESHAKWFDKHEPAQARFEENEEWLEELEERVSRVRKRLSPMQRTT